MIRTSSLPNSSHDFGWIGKKNIAKYGSLLCPEALSEGKSLSPLGLALCVGVQEEWQPPQCDSVGPSQAGAQEPGILDG